MLVIDMCPQANIYQLLLGGGKEGYENNQKLQGTYTRCNVVGFIYWILKANADFKSLPKNSTYKVRASLYNESIPENLYLIAGDSFLESLSLALNYSVLNPANITAWKNHMTAIKRLCRSEFDKEKYKELVVFIDCNPSFSIYTQMALLSSDYLIIPMMADFTSLEGIKGILMLLYEQYPSESLKKYASKVITFNKQVKQFELKLPKIKQFVFNNYTSHKGVAKAYKYIRQELINFCYKQYQSFPQYFTRNDNSLDSLITWQNAYVTDVKDFHSSGKVSASIGTPLHQLPDKGEIFKMPDGEEITLAKHRYEEAVENVKYLVSKL
ncbi:MULTISPECIES: ParA family protein [Okeania]|uniref:ParA family protein n=1 Tax=Okeania TaxID=1458928 RepID=UPI0023D9386C|nr:MULTISPECIES: ParA family protein [Okeania]